MIGKAIILLLSLSQFGFSKGNTERAGDILTLLIPAVAYGNTIYTNDNKGQMEFYKAYGSTIVLTHLLKETVRAPRPNRPDSHTSFPSGHTSSAFSGAAFIHKKYGLTYALPAYSRVYAKKHFTRDVMAGAAIGIGFSWYFATSYKNFQISPEIGSDSYGLQLHYKW
jgi:membrane-associated phospholipid phosphatase